MFKERGSWSGRWPRQGCLQTKDHGESGNALKDGGKKGGRGSIWDWMEKESLGVSHINGLPPKPFLHQLSQLLLGETTVMHRDWNWEWGSSLWGILWPDEAQRRGARWVWAWLVKQTRVTSQRKWKTRRTEHPKNLPRDSAVPSSGLELKVYHKHNLQSHTNCKAS